VLKKKKNFGLAALSTNENGGSTIRFWKNGANPTPLWEQTLIQPSNYIAIDDEQNNLVVGTNFEQKNIYQAFLYAWIGGTGKPRMFFAGNNTYIRKLVISSNGNYAAFVSENIVFVVTISTMTLRDKIVFEASDSDLCISPDGNTIGYGFENFNVLTWNSASNHYELIVSFKNDQNFYSGRCAFSQTKLVTINYRSDYLQNYVSFYEFKNKIPIRVSRYNFKVASTPGYQNFPSAITISPDGNFVALSTWGCMVNSQCPQINIFYNYALFSQYVSPGSINSIDLVQNGETYWVVAAGKNVHNNVMGDGGNVFAFKISNQ